MTTDRSRVDRDGVRITRTRRTSVLIPGLVLLGIAGWLVTRTLRAEPPRPERGTPPATPPVAPRAADNPAPSAAPTRNPEIAERAHQRREERQVEQRAKSEAPFTVNKNGEQAGISAFPPPGTKPIKRGIVVPDDYELPDGYVRHYQTTDDGRRLPPILMYRPDFAGVDGNGNPIVVPEDRVVPPELAPPGLPRRTLDETDEPEDDAVRRHVHTEKPAPTGRR